MKSRKKNDRSNLQGTRSKPGIIKFIDTIVAEVGKPKHAYESCAIPDELFAAIKEIVPPAEMEVAVFSDDKQTREENIRVITEKLEGGICRQRRMAGCFR